MANYDVVVIGASAGGVGSLQKLVARLPDDFAAAVAVTLHLPADVRSALPDILSRAGPVPARHAEHGEAIQPGRIYVAPPGFHLTLGRNHVRVIRGAREHGHRPAIDPLFRSAAVAFGARAIGVILSGLLDDGTVGLLELKRAGGVAIVQDPADTEWPSMPRSALAHVAVDYCVPADRIGDLLQELVGAAEVPGMPNGTPDREAARRDVRAREIDALTDREDERSHPGEPSTYSCPECGGVLWELSDGEIARFRCRVGHAYTGETLGSERGLTIEHALWAALRALEEQASLQRRLGDRARRNDRPTTADRYARRERELVGQAQQVRELLLTGVGAAVEE